MNAMIAPHLGRLKPGPPTLSFSEDEFLAWLGSCEVTLENETASWVEQSQRTVEQLADDGLGDDAEWHLGFAVGRVSILGDLAYLTKGIDVPTPNVVRAAKRQPIEIDLLIREHVIEFHLDTAAGSSNGPSVQQLLPAPADHSLTVETTSDEDAEYSVANSIISLRLEGAPITAICDRLKLSRSLVLMHLRTAGLPLRGPADVLVGSEPEAPAPTVLPTSDDCELIAEIIYLRHQNGWGINKIARHVRTSTRMVKAALAASGLSLQDVSLPEDKEPLETAIALRAKHGLSGPEIALSMDDNSIPALLADEGYSLPKIGPYWGDELAEWLERPSAKQMLSDMRNRARRLRQDGWSDDRIIQLLQQEVPEKFHEGIRLALTRPGVTGQWTAV